MLTAQYKMFIHNVYLYGVYIIIYIYIFLRKYILSHYYQRDNFYYIKGYCYRFEFIDR